MTAPYHEYIHAWGQSTTEWCELCDRPWSAVIHRSGPKTDGTRAREATE